MAKNHSTTTFQEDWLSGPIYQVWVRKNPDKPTKAHCILCRSTLDIATGGKTALDSHQSGKNHIALYNERLKNKIGNFFGASSNTSSSKKNASEIDTPSQLKLPFDLGTETLNAEILWCMYMVESHQSFRSCDKLPELFKRMFQHDPVAQKYKLKKDKSRYFIVHGIYPVFKDSLVRNINQSPWFSVSFDESFNKDQQKCQMDINIRYWNQLKNIAETGYLTSCVLLRPNAENLCEELFTSIAELDKQKFLHLAMDGPNTNWLVLNLVDGRLGDDGFSSTLNVGSCSLHILHGAFATGIQGTSWSLGKLMKAMFKILDESPARRDVYLKAGFTELFPQSFAETRWVEDEPVAERALDVWPSIVTLVRHFEGLCQSKRPKNKSYDTFVTHHTDLLVPAKLHFFFASLQVL